MSSPEIIDLFAESIEVEPSTLAPETLIADVPEWNSLGWLTIMSLLDERCQISLSAKQIRGFKTVSDVISAVNEQLVAKKG
jgi:acyl carrier protein